MSSFSIIATVFLFLFLNACSVSSLFNLKEPAPVFSNDLILPSLPSDFNPQPDSAFPYWKNKKTSNVISVFSDCADSNMNLKTAHASITNAIDNETVIEERKVNLKNMPGYFRKITGQIDGHDIEINSTSFKYKNCLFVSSLSGQRTKINSDLENWQNFNQNIEFKK